MGHGISSCFSTFGKIFGIRRSQDLAAFEFVAEVLLAGEDEAVFGGEELLTLAEDGVADEGVVLVGAEDDAAKSSRGLQSALEFWNEERTEVLDYLCEVSGAWPWSLSGISEAGWYGSPFPGRVWRWGP